MSSFWNITKSKGNGIVCGKFIWPAISCSVCVWAATRERLPNADPWFNGIKFQLTSAVTYSALPFANQLAVVSTIVVIKATARNTLEFEDDLRSALSTTGLNPRIGMLTKRKQSQKSLK